MNHVRRIGLVVLYLAASAAPAQTLYTNLATLQQELGQTLCTFALGADGVTQATEVDGVIRTTSPLTYTGPTANSSVGPVLSFEQSPPFFTLQTLQSGANFTFDDDEGNNLASFDNALSIGDIDDHENDDFRISVPATRPMNAIGLMINDSSAAAGEQLRLLDANGALVGNPLDLSGVLAGNVFVGVVSAQPFYGVELDESPDDDDIALAAIYFESCTGADSYEPDDQPQDGPFLDGFDFLTDDGDLVRELVRTIDSPTDVDWILFASTYNYPANAAWGQTPNTELYVQLCQGACDGLASAPLNLQMFNFDLIANPETATPVFELNACPGNANDEIERQLPNFVNDESLFVRVSACDGATDVNYRLLLRRAAVGIDLFKITGQVSLFDASGDLSPAPAYAIITSNQGDFAIANPADGTYQLATLARRYPDGGEIPDMMLTVELFRAPFEAIQSKPVFGMEAGETQVINFVLNLFADGFEDRP